jgi:hypothetical protein
VPFFSYAKGEVPSTASNALFFLLTKQTKSLIHVSSHVLKYYSSMQIFIFLMFISANVFAYESEEDKEHFGDRDCQKEAFNYDIGRKYLFKMRPLLKSKSKTPEVICDELSKEPEIMLAVQRGKISFNKIKSEARFKDTTSVENLPTSRWKHAEAEVSKAELCTIIRCDIDAEDDLNGSFRIIGYGILKTDFLNSDKESCLKIVPEMLKAIEDEQWPSSL